jgi:hypothetical protein
MTATAGSTVRVASSSATKVCSGSGATSSIVVAHYPGLSAMPSWLQIESKWLTYCGFVSVDVSPSGVYAPRMFRGPLPHRPDTGRLDRLRKGGERRSELDGVELKEAPKSKKETVVYGVILLAVLLLAIVVLMRIL